MDYRKKRSHGYKKKQASKVLKNVPDLDCSKIPVALKVPRPDGSGTLDGAVGISVAGLETNIAVPNAGLTLDAGKHVDLVLERDLLVSHYDGDHVEGIGRAICNAMNRKTKLDIFLPSLDDHPDLESAIREFTEQDESGFVTLHEMEHGDRVRRGNKIIEAFNVVHAPESKGFTAWEKNDEGSWKRKITYTGDINPSKMDMKIPSITDAETVVIDGTLSGSFLPLFEPIVDLFTNHGSTREIIKISREDKGVENIGIMHITPNACNDVKRDLEKRFSVEDERIYFLDSCWDGSGADPMEKMASFKLVS